MPNMTFERYLPPNNPWRQTITCNIVCAWKFEHADKPTEYYVSDTDYSTESEGFRVSQDVYLEALRRLEDTV